MADIIIRFSDKSFKIAKVGILAVFTASLLMYLWASRIRNRWYHLSVYVPEAAGLTVGSQVLVDTLPVGKVDAVKLAESSANTQRRIELGLLIEKRFQNDIRSDSTATIATEGLLGSPLVSIRRAFDGPPIKPGGEIPFIQMPGATAKDFLNVLMKLADCEKQTKQPAKSTSP
jgi:phospholipid/cholesterol/gamma-HCH transport system substrate-binding protein